MRAPGLFWLAVALLGGCGASDPVALDIQSFDLSPNSVPPTTTSEGEVADLEVFVLAGQLRTVLGRGGVIDLELLDCTKPEGPVQTYPVYLGTTPISELRFNPVDSDPTQPVRLAVPVPLRRLERHDLCARFAGRPGAFAPEVASAPTPVWRDQAARLPPEVPVVPPPPGYGIEWNEAEYANEAVMIVPPPPPIPRSPTKSER